jgi:hypothetical protein
MELFVDIAQRCLQHHNVVAEEDDYWKTSAAVMFQMRFHCLNLQGTKLQKYKTMMNNLFFSQAFQATISQLFCATQRVYHALSRCAFCWKVKHAKRVVDHDLCLEPLNLANPRQYLTLFQGQVTYHFKVQDMVQLVETALCHASDFFVKPYVPRNPYTNEPFSLAMLVCIYERIRVSGYRMPVLLELFFRSCACNVEKFAFQHEGYIRECYIERTVKYGDVEMLSHHVRCMLRYVQVFPYLDNRFPKTTLVNLFRPYLGLYMCHIFSTIYGEKKDRSYCTLHNKLHQLMDYNPLLGRPQLLQKKTFVNTGKYILLPSPYNNTTPFVEVFSIDVLPFDSLVNGCKTDEEDEEEEQEDF